MRQTGGRGQFGHVVINVEPAPGEGFDFVNKIKGGAIPSEFIPAVEQGIEEALGSGIRAGYPMVDVRVELIDGSYHDVDSSEMAFKIAGSMAVQEAARRANPVLLEPVMAVEVVTPEDFLGEVIGDLSRRRGKVQGQEPRGNAVAIQAFVPLGRDVRLRHRPAFLDAGQGQLHDAVRALRGGPGEHRRADSSSTAAPNPWRRRSFPIFPGFARENRAAVHAQHRDQPRLRETTSHKGARCPRRSSSAISRM